MAKAQSSLESEIKNLRKDADTVLKDLGQISQSIQTKGTEAGQELKEETKKIAQSEIDDIKKRLDQVQKMTKKYGRSIDQSIKRNPYAYVIGGTCLGLILGRVFNTKKK